MKLSERAHKAFHGPKATNICPFLGEVCIQERCMAWRGECLILK